MKETLQLMSQKKKKKDYETTVNNYTPNKLVNVKEMDTFLETYNWPRLDHEEIKIPNRSITSEEI